MIPFVVLSGQYTQALYQGLIKPDALRVSGYNVASLGFDDNTSRFPLIDASDVTASANDMRFVIYLTLQSKEQWAYRAMAVILP